MFRSLSLTNNKVGDKAEVRIVKCAKFDFVSEPKNILAWATGVDENVERMKASTQYVDAIRRDKEAQVLVAKQNKSTSDATGFHQKAVFR